jgi:hypothetical protein
MEKNGAKVQQWDYGNVENQLFKLVADGEYYRIVAKCSNKCLDIPSENMEKNGAKLQQWDCNDVDNQQFKIIAEGEYYRIVAKCSNKCLDIPSENMEKNGAKVQQWDCNDVDNQLFKIVDLSNGVSLNLSSNSPRSRSMGKNKPIYNIKGC